ncbi:hypothetical protein [Paenibacillus herberti]|uniref:Uncharacterized protein n=1 Tax=Paenibacillus herberti TaxID=1619309 RepID=A0A229NT88_9BACL|nr:hypothetical protein [Paenibacillus herberti]OXM13111.1 hypothetical protein CGZ75_23355 [Paenibacillus herberti]
MQIYLLGLPLSIIRKREEERGLKLWSKMTLSALGAIAVLTGVGLYGANYATEKALAGMLAELPSASETAVADQAKSHGGGASSGGGSNSGANNGASDKADGGSPGNGTGAKSDGGQTESGSAGQNSSGKSGAEISEEEAKTAAERLSLAEKSEALGIIVKGLDAGEIRELKGLAEGGLDAGEKQELKTKLREQLDEADYERLTELARKAQGSDSAATKE